MIDPFSWISKGAQSLVDLYGVNKNYQAQIETNKSNERNVAATNASNERMVAATNAANVEQANLAYERSKPLTQVANMMDAGMSKSAALQSLSGGGVYTPPALQTATAEPFIGNAPQLDYKGISNAIDRLGNLPSSQVQLDIQREQLNALKAEAVNRANEEKRKQEMHDALLDEKKYSKWERESMDEFFSLMENTAQEKNIQPKPDQSMHDYVRELGLQDNELYKQLSVSSRQRAFDRYKSIQEEHRAQSDFKDKHDLSVLEQELKSFDLDERKRSLVYRLGILANNLELSSYQVDDAHKDAIIRDAGFANEKEAKEAIRICENLEAISRKNKSRFVANRSDSPAAHFGYGIEWIMDKITPFKGLLSK